MTNSLIAVLAAVILVESEGNPYALNEAEQAYGATQIRQGALDDLNKHYSTAYKLTDFIGNEQLARWAFLMYPPLYGAKTPEECCRAWNSGPPWRERYHLTDGYWEKVKAAIEPEGARHAPESTRPRQKAKQIAGIRAKHKRRGKIG